MDQGLRRGLDTLSLDGAPDARTQQEVEATALQAVDRTESLLAELGARAGERDRAGDRQAAAGVPGVHLLRHVEGRAYEEIAEMLDLPLGTVKTYIYRARQELREYLEPMRAKPPPRPAVGGDEGGRRVTHNDLNEADRYDAGSSGVRRACRHFRRLRVSATGDGAGATAQPLVVFRRARAWALEPRRAFALAAGYVVTAITTLGFAVPWLPGTQRRLPRSRRLGQYPGARRLEGLGADAGRVGVLVRSHDPSRIHRKRPLNRRGRRS